jgi:hypothetical protein
VPQGVEAVLGGAIDEWERLKAEEIDEAEESSDEGGLFLLSKPHKLIMYLHSCFVFLLDIFRPLLHSITYPS